MARDYWLTVRSQLSYTLVVCQRASYTKRWPPPKLDFGAAEELQRYITIIFGLDRLTTLRHD